MAIMACSHPGYLHDWVVLIICVYKSGILFIICICTQQTLFHEIQDLCSALFMLLRCNHRMFDMQNFTISTASKKSGFWKFLF